MFDFGWCLIRSARTLARQPSFTMAALLTLGIGIGCASAAFGVWDTLLVQPLPHRDAGRLVMVWRDLTRLELMRAPLSPARSWWAIFIFMIALMFNYLDRQLMTLLITPIKADFGLSDTQISLLIGFAFVLFYVLAGIPIARFIDRGPRKWIVVSAIAFWSAMTVACGLARSDVI